MVTVNYNGHTITDAEVNNVLQAICNFFEANVNVTSGDRKTVPSGGSNTSAHLDGRAADFHVEGYDDGTTFLYMKVFASAIFAGGNSYQIIWHGGLNPQIKAHIHVGRYAKTSDLWGYALFQKEGTKASNIGITKMTTDIKLPLIAVPSR